MDIHLRMMFSLPKFLNNTPFLFLKEHDTVEDYQACRAIARQAFLFDSDKGTISM